MGLFGVLAACGPDAIRVEPCMRVSDLIERTKGLAQSDFDIEAGDELSTDEIPWKRLSFMDGASPLLELFDAPARLRAYRGHVTSICTKRIFGGPIGDLPRTMGPIRDSFMNRGFVLDRSTPGDFLSTSGNESLRLQIYVRDDMQASLMIDIERNGTVFMYDLCVYSGRVCRSPGIILLEEAGEKDLDEFAPRVRPPPHHVSPDSAP